MTYLTDELRGIDSALSDLRARVQALEQQIAQLSRSIPVRYATERQKAFINDICATLNIPYPPCAPSAGARASSSRERPWPGARSASAATGRSSAVG